MNCNPTETGYEGELQEHIWHSQYLIVRKMFSRVMNKVRSPEKSSGTNNNGNNQGQQESDESGKVNAIELFYESMGDGLSNLESSLSGSNDSVSFFQVEWLVLGVSFLHSVHLETLALVETVWLPAKSVLGPDSLSDYLDVSMTLLDTCNNLKEAMNQLETYQMSMDLILRRLISAASLSPNMDSDDDDPAAASDSSSYLKPLAECKRELDRLDAKNDSYSMWVELVPKHDLGEKILKANSLARTKSVYPLPATPIKKKTREVSVVLYDVQVVTSFVSHILLWIITGQAGDRQSPTAVKLDLATKPKVREQKPSSLSPSPWSTFLFRLKDKVERSVEYIQNSNSKRFMKLQDVISLQSSLKSLRAQLESGFREGKFVHGTEFAEKIKTLLEQKRQTLAELTKTFERISAQLNDMFREIIDGRKKVLDMCESRPLFHAFSI